jgi:hypothetical protein
MPNFPFTRAKPLGFSLFEVFTSSQANTIDQNAAQAADGLVWTDVAQFRNWSGTQSIPTGLITFGYNSVEDVWWGIGVSAGNPTTAYMLGAGGLFQSGPAAGTSLTVRKRAFAYRPTGNIMLWGGLPGASSNKKFLQNTGSGFSTLATSSSQTNTTAVSCLGYFPTGDLFIAGHEGTGVVETSPDGVTFTNRTVPNANARMSMAIGPVNGASGGIVISSSVSTNQVIQSVDGINWNARTMPASKVWHVVYVPLLGKYVATADDLTAVAFSLDGITWSTQAFTLPTNLLPINAGNDLPAVAAGRTVFVMCNRASGSGTNGLIYSQDGGATWKYAASFGNGTGSLVTNGKQLFVVASGPAAIWSLGGGF